MSLNKLFNNLQDAVDKMKDYAEKEIEGKRTTIMHPEVYSTVNEAKRAFSDVSFRAFYSSKKEFGRRNRGI